MELMGCQGLAVPAEVMQHVVRVESSFNPYAIGVVGGRLVRQPGNLSEAVATARMLERQGYNFSLGLAQVNQANLRKYGLETYEKAFQSCPNLKAASRILAECYARAEGDWPKAFSCYYSGDFSTGFKQGYVQKIYASVRDASVELTGNGDAIPLAKSEGDAIGRLARRGDASAAKASMRAGARAGNASPSAGPARVSLAGAPPSGARDAAQQEIRSIELPDRPASDPASQQVETDTAFVF
jgi:type IV secretion system protein VirB1